MAISDYKEIFYFHLNSNQNMPQVFDVTVLLTLFLGSVYRNILNMSSAIRIFLFVSEIKV